MKGAVLPDFRWEGKSLKTIGIVTINDYLNYGNRLQNYATQEVLKSLGYQVQTIVNVPPKDSARSRLVRIANMPFGEVIGKTLHRVNRRKSRDSINQRIGALKQFTRDNIIETPFDVSQYSIPSNLDKEFDYFIVGSDQVWNPAFRRGSPIDFLTFAPPSKRIAYSASFGISEIPGEFTESYRKWITEMAHVSVREEAGARIVKKLTGRDSVVLVDPTLMLTPEEWLLVSKPARRKPDSDYMLMYFLGELGREYNETIGAIASKYDLEIVQLASLDDSARYEACPGEFLDYVNSARIVLTDSFHGVIFSILFEKPFMVFERVGSAPSMSSRFGTLLDKFRMEDRKWGSIGDNKDVMQVDYSHVPTILEAERKKALGFLRNALGV